MIVNCCEDTAMVDSISAVCGALQLNSPIMLRVYAHTSPYLPAVTLGQCSVETMVPRHVTSHW